ncbi:hypothetical protein TEK04_01135 [Klenkia sp. LSe6-5]|uniref:Uncharacterized protein n=1 Tax=Klenkia sesuvii TaxID=3103137 RepID=A0ABU8DNI5_9ACTN
MTAQQLPDGTYWEHRGLTYRGTVRPGGRTVLLLSSEPAEGFAPRATGGWGLEVPRADAVRTTLRTTCRWRGEAFQVMAQEGDQLVLRHLGSSRTARDLGLTEVDRGVFNATVPATEVSEIAQQRTSG